jgi:hypothetical protein
VRDVLTEFTRWLDRCGETSFDHQSFFGGPYGRFAKRLYYKNKLLGTAAVAPMIFSEAFVPSARKLFHQRVRFPIADAHYAMGFASLSEITGDPQHLNKAQHFLEELKKSRSPGFKEYCWGYPYDWVTRNGTIKAQTPLITSTPYMFEAFQQVAELLEAEGGGQRTEDRGQRTEDGGRRTEDGGRRTERSNLASEYKEILESIPRHSFNDIKEFPTSENASSCSYTPFDKGGVINAAAYRGFLLMSAARIFGNDDYAKSAERNLNFVLENQNPDGSWFYAVDGVRDFVDHFHTCFVMKALAKVVGLGEGEEDRGQRTEDRGRRTEGAVGQTDSEFRVPHSAFESAVTGQMSDAQRSVLGPRSSVLGPRPSEATEARTLEALRKGVDYYLKNLFDPEDGLPKPFSRAPRMTVYKRELYDCAECINLCLLLRDRFPELDAKLHVVVRGILRDWIKPDGSFRSRRLHFGWDNVPMHRWAQAQMFRALARYARDGAKHLRSEDGGPRTEDRG